MIRFPLKESPQADLRCGWGLALQLTPAILVCVLSTAPLVAQKSVARFWNDEVLEAIRGDLARPTVHARNLFHSSGAMYDAWAAYDDQADTYLHHERATAVDVEAAREEAISFAAYRIIEWRFRDSPGRDQTLTRIQTILAGLGYDPTDSGTVGDTPSALGNRVAATWIAYGLTDGSNESNDYANRFYEPVNPPLFPVVAGTSGLVDPNRWQPLSLDVFIDQGGNVVPGATPEFVSPEWGWVSPFALREEDMTVGERDGFEYRLYHDPGPPPLLGTAREDQYLSGFEQVLEWSSLLDPADGMMIDISPGTRGNNPLGTNSGSGRATNPLTGQPYASNVVFAADYYRVLAEFWADGPDSETPPGHWFVIANEVTDQIAEKRFQGSGELLNDLEWDVKLYFALGGTMHDVAIAAWGAKGWYDYVRPISVIRHLAAHQRTDPTAANYDPVGLALEPGRVEIITELSSEPGGRHEHLRHRIGDIAVWAWRGPNYISNPSNDTAGVGWILASEWWPYQRPSFVTPPFAAYVSGHSTYSRAAAELLTLFTGSEFFPGGVGEFQTGKNRFLVFEEGPSTDLKLQWATYYDAADECSLSRIYGGIHPTQDDIPGRFMGSKIGPDSFALAKDYFDGRVTGGPEPCVAGETTMCLNDGRFRVEVEWTNASGASGSGQVVPVSSEDSGLFWFFSEDNWEMLVKVLDGCAVNDRFWVFAAATTDVGFRLEVTDSETGSTYLHENPVGVAAPALTDTAAFSTCSP